MNKRVFVTGAAGFVGANIIHRLIYEGYSVHIAVRSGGSLWRLKEVLEKITIHEEVLSDKILLKRTLTKIQPEGIFHLAAYGSYPTQQDAQLMISTNISGLLNLLEASRDIPYRRFVVSGSSSEYGKKNIPMRENDYVEPNNMYAVTKIAATHMALYWGKVFHKPVNVFRLFNVYGSWEEEGRLVRTVIESALNNDPVKLVSGREARDFIYAGDVADAFLYILKTKKQVDGEIFNLGTGKQSTIKQLADKVIKLTGSTSPIVLHAYEGRPWDTYHWRADVHKTTSILGWKAKTRLTDGLKKTIEWYRNTRLVESP